MKRKLLALLLAFACFTPLHVFASGELYVGGDSIGIEMKYDGVMITGTYTMDGNGIHLDPVENDIKQGDIIKKVEDTTIASLTDLYDAIASYKDKVNTIPIEIERDAKILSRNLTTIYNEKDASFQSGLYIKDSIKGVGTITFYDPLHKTFGALGHEVMDQDLKSYSSLQKGTIYPSNVTSITKAQPHVAGEKHADIDQDQPIGTIVKNTEIGIYGTYESLPDDAEKMIWANQEEIHTGKAEIRSVLKGDTIQTFEITITKVHDQNESAIKGIEFEITDATLLEKTNGIVQGMSGSPIIQDNKIIGAVTHVITAKPAMGYGVYIEWMLQEANS